VTQGLGVWSAGALGLQAYLEAFLPAALDPRWIGSAAIVGAGLLHGARRGLGVGVQNVAVALKVVLILGFLAAGAAAFPDRVGSAPARAEPVAWARFPVAVVWVSFAYSGWNAAAYVAGELRDPGRDLVRALVGATGFVTVLYLGLNAVFLFAAPAEALRGQADVGAVAAYALGGARLRGATAALVALALFTAISSMVMAGPRVYARMADDGLLPRFLVGSAGAPRAAVALQGMLALAVMWVADLVEILGSTGFALNLSAAASVAGLLRLRRREGPERVPLPGYPVVPGVFIAATLGLCLATLLRAPRIGLVGCGLVLLGVPAYACLARKGAGAMASAARPRPMGSGAGAPLTRCE
jgi:APA family basic amino acid/polyamine antiporter